MSWVHNNILLPLCEPGQHSGLGRRLRALERFDALTRPEQLALQEKRIRTLLDHAYQTCPYYRLLFDEMGVRAIDWRQGHPIPVPELTPGLLRANFDNICSRAFRPDQLRRAETGGRLPVWRDLEGLRNKTALEYHLNQRSGFDQGMPVLQIAGAESGGEARRSWGRRFYQETLLGRVKCGVDQRNGASFSHWLDELNQQQPEVIYGDTGTLEPFANWLRNAGQRWHKPRLVIAAGESFSSDQRLALEETFECVVTFHFVIPDIGMIASECPEGGRLHIHPWASYVALRPAGQSPAGPLYRLVITDLLNYGMPLLRYDTGACVLYEDSPCACGSWYPSVTVMPNRAASKDGGTPSAAAPCAASHTAPAA